MADMIQSGLAWLTGKRADYASTPLTLSSGRLSYQVRATMAKRSVEVVGDGGTTMASEVMTAIVPTADLQGHTPIGGDLLAGSGKAFEIRPPAAGAPAWEWADAHQTAIRLYLRERSINAKHATG